MIYDPERDPGRVARPPNNQVRNSGRLRRALGATVLQKTGVRDPKSGEITTSQAEDKVRAVGAAALQEMDVRDPESVAFRFQSHATKGGTVSYAQVLSSLRELKQRASDQIMYIEAFQKEHRTNIQMIRESLSGGASGHDNKMIQAITEAESSLKRSRSVLDAAIKAIDKLSNR